MNKTVNSILSRALSEEIARQKKWKEEDIKQFGKCITNRDDIIKDIKSFMVENEIEFRTDYYTAELHR